MYDIPKVNIIHLPFIKKIFKTYINTFFNNNATRHVVRVIEPGKPTVPFNTEEITQRTIISPDYVFNKVLQDLIHRLWGVHMRLPPQTKTNLLLNILRLGCIESPGYCFHLFVPHQSSPRWSLSVSAYAEMCIDQRVYVQEAMDLLQVTLLIILNSC